MARSPTPSISCNLPPQLSPTHSSSTARNPGTTTETDSQPAAGCRLAVVAAATQRSSSLTTLRGAAIDRLPDRNPFQPAPSQRLCVRGREGGQTGLGLGPQKLEAGSRQWNKRPPRRTCTTRPPAQHHHPVLRQQPWHGQTEPSLWAASKPCPLPPAAPNQSPSADPAAEPDGRGAWATGWVHGATASCCWMGPRSGKPSLPVVWCGAARGGNRAVRLVLPD